ncbi:MAG: hypothetical protein LBC53_09545 [Spirochaetaceae bacterium]|jgi:hypothetical protein|nr:hypothetical protein [Spirochaetaceae bacterium]
MSAARYLRLRNSAGGVKVEDVPVLIPKDALEAIKGNEEAPYEIIETLPFPSEGMGGLYTGSYFESLLEQMKARPLGGSKTGHGNQNDDFFTIGGKVEYTAENAGVCYLRIIVPRMGYETTNEGFIRSCKAGNQEFSLVANVEEERNANGEIIFTKDVGKARNDAVSEGAMDQTLNAAKEREIFALIEKGAIDIESEGKETIAAGKVRRKAALYMQFNGPDRALGARITNAIANKLKQQNEESKKMTKDEIVKAVQAAVSNNELTMEELAKAVNLENKLRNAEDEKRAALISALTKELEMPPDSPPEKILEAVTAILKAEAETAEAAGEAEANALAGTAGMSAKNKKENGLYCYAKKVLSGKRGREFTNAVEGLKTDPVVLSLRSKRADGDFQVLENSKSKNPFLEKNRLEA